MCVATKELRAEVKHQAVKFLFKDCKNYNFDPISTKFVAGDVNECDEEVKEA